jgi:uncharacterized membrane protein YfcA
VGERLVHRLPVGGLMFIYLPAFLGVLIPGVLMASAGARLAAHLLVAMLKNVFVGFLFVLALKMVYLALFT